MHDLSPKCIRMPIGDSTDCGASKTLAKPSARARRAPARNLQQIVLFASVSTTPALPITAEAARVEPAEPRRKLTKRQSRRLLVSTDTEFFSESHYCATGSWSACWCVHYQTVRRGTRIVKPEMRIYFRLYRQSSNPNGSHLLTPITGADYASIDALLPAHTRGVWLSVIGQAAIASAYRGVPLLKSRVTYRQIVEALTGKDMHENSVTQRWKDFINQQLRFLTSIYYERKGETGAERTVFVCQPARLPLLGVEWHSNDPDAVYINACSELFWILNGVGRTRVVPASVAFPREPWSYCICAEILARVCRTPINGRANIKELFSPDACKAVREQYERSESGGNLARERKRLIDAVKRLFESLVSVGTLKSYKEHEGVFTWQKKDHGQSLSEQGIYARLLSLAAEKFASGEVGFCGES